MLTVAALYHFARLDDPAALRPALVELGRAHDLTGSLLLAREGVNGTVAGPRAGIDALLAHLRAWPGCADLEHKESWAETPPFGRFKVKLKAEIVTMGQPDVDPRASVGHYLNPAEWNDLLRQPDVAVIDTRNDYEVALGTFAGAVDPGTKTFREFPAWWAENAHRFHNKRIAMFCTGGIRCEKSTNWLLQQGVDQVFHLKGGILKYLEDMPETDSLWQGRCYVFDERVSLGHGLVPGDDRHCGAFRRPVTPEGRQHPDYEEGVCCPACVDEYTPDDRARFRERMKQMRLAAQRGERHLGAHPRTEG